MTGYIYTDTPQRHHSKPRLKSPSLPHHLVGALLGGLLQLLESGDPAVLLRLVLCQYEHLALEPHTALLVAGDLEDGRDELGPSVNHVVRGHLGDFKTLIPIYRS